MNDRELLEMAAKAIGKKITKYPDQDGRYRVFSGVDTGWGPGDWNPLDDDGDAFRLAIKLGICIQFIPSCDTAQVYQEREETGEPYNNHVAALGDLELRRIITQAAAEIGKSIP